MREWPGILGANGKGKLIFGMRHRSPFDPSHLAVKRVIALEGDRVATKSPYPFPIEDIPKGHVWVEGDHPESARRSGDSNYYGPVSKSLVIGTVEDVVWPWSRRQRLRWQDYKGNPRVRKGANPVEEVVFY